ncbi:MAG TPA: hypothetical protein VKY74_25845 [Chloroflexia bacterium]|nr:hypothetical protein [Chloroflexia bacterium]
MRQDDQVTLQELAERLLAPHQGRQRDPLNPEPAALELTPGQLPAGLPVQLPAWPGARLIGSVAQRDTQGLVSWDVIWDVPGDSVALADSAEQSLAAQGWQRLEDRRLGLMIDGGFQVDPQTPPPAAMLARLARQRPPIPAEMQARINRFEAIRPQQRMFTAPPAPGTLQLTVTPRPDSPTEVRLHSDPVDWAPFRMRRQMPTGVTGHLPALTPPPGVLLLPGGGGGSPHNWTSRAGALTDQTPATLEAHFASQLTAAGWTRAAAAAAESLAWSLWAIPAVPGAQGFLLVRVAPDPGRLHLLVQIEAAQSTGAGEMTSFVQGHLHMGWP